MHKDDLQAYLHRQIPLSAAMEVGVVSVSADHVVLTAPLGPNINHKATVFGGSASALAILSAWSLLHLRLEAAGLASEIVIQSNHMDYERPITGRFLATSSLAEDADWDGFVRMLRRKKVARLEVRSELGFQDAVAGRLSGRFVAFLREGSS